MNPKRQKSLKPLLEVGQPVYSAYWGPTDVDRDETDPAWYPGIVASYKVSKLPDDEMYGQVRYYSINFDDGDVMTDVPDHFVMTAEEYLLFLRDDEDEDHSWLGVKNVRDRRSNDEWARQVGWFVTTFDDDDGDHREHTFSLLSDALRAHDAHVVRTKGMLLIEESDLNLPEDWKELFDVQEKVTRLVKRSAQDGDMASASEVARIKEEAKERIKAAKEDHKAEIDRLKHQLHRKHESDKEVAIREAVVKEKRAMREIQSQEKKDRKARHAEEIDVLRDHFEHEQEEAKNEAAAVRESSQRQQLKPIFDAGEAVVAAWWPDMKRQDTASWYPGHVKSYREVEGQVIQGNYYGPTRVYHVKYDDDGTELTDVPEQYVFPRKDYELSTSRPIDHLWKGVENVTDDLSSDAWAKYVGWYNVDYVFTDGNEQEQPADFTRLSDALHAYDANIVRRKGDKTRRRDLNLPDEWEWLLNKNWLKDTKSFSNQEMEQEKQKMKSRLEKKYEHDKEVSVREALEHAKMEFCQERRETQNKLRNDLKERSKKDNDEAINQLKEFYKKDKAETINSLKKWYATDKANDIETLKEFYEQEKKKAVNLAKQTFEGKEALFESEKALAMEKLRGELHQQFYHEKEKASYWLRVELKQLQKRVEEMENQNVELDLLKREKAASTLEGLALSPFTKDDQTMMTLKRKESSSISPDTSPRAPVKRLKVSNDDYDHDNGGMPAAISLHREISSDRPRGASMETTRALPLPPLSRKKRYSEGSEGDHSVLNKDQFAGEQTNEKMHRDNDNKQQNQHAAVNALLSFADKV